MKKILTIILAVSFIFVSTFFLAGCKKEYTLTVDAGILHGQIQVSKTKARQGEEIIVTATAEQGYYLNVATLTANNILIIDFKFIMPAENVVINAEFLLPGITSLDITGNLESLMELLHDEYINQPNTNDGGVEIVEMDIKLEQIFYATLYPVTENEEYTVKIFGQTISNKTERIALGNNRFFELPLYKKTDARFMILSSALVRYTEDGIVQISVDSDDYKLYLDFELYNILSISQLTVNGLEGDFEDNVINMSFSADTMLQISLNLYEEPVFDSYSAYSSLVLHFDDETSSTINIFGAVSEGVYELGLLHEILPEGKTLAGIDVFTHVYELGFINYSINIVD